MSTTDEYGAAANGHDDEWCPPGGGPAGGRPGASGRHLSSQNIPPAPPSPNAPDPAGVAATGVVPGEVVDAELVSTQDTPEVPGSELVRRTRIRTAPQSAVGRLVGPARSGAAVVVRAAGPVVRVARSEKARATAGRAVRATARNVVYVPAGAGVVARRVRDATTTARYQRMLRAAEAAGDRVAVAEWEERRASFLDARQRRITAILAAPAQVARAGAVTAFGLAVVLLLAGIVSAISARDITIVFGPLIGGVNLVASLVDLAAWVWAPVTMAAPFVLVGYLWYIGRRDTTPPKWVMAPDAPGADRQVVPDEGAILSALHHLGVPALNKKIKDGWVPRWTMATGRDGKGYRTQLELPQGVTVDMIAARKDVLAHNLVRLPVEVWPTEPRDRPGVLDLWVADQGLLSGPVAPYPLLDDGECDYFAGVPVAVDQRGENVTAKLMASNYGIAGTMGSGKSSLVINLLVGAALDPLVEIDVYVLAHNVDYNPLAPVLRTLVIGDEPQHIAAALDALRVLREDVTTRGKVLAELGGEETKLTRDIAARDARMRPRVVVFDECQELFRHDKHGEEAKEQAVKLMMKARKVGITLLFVTPEPSADSLPRALAKTASHGVCFAIGDHQGNDAILGTGAHSRGVSATSLVAGEDVGTAMAKGFSARPGLIRTYHLRKDKSVDQITPVITRAVAARVAANLDPTPPAITAPDDQPDQLDVLADVADVISHTPRMRTQEVLTALATRRPDPYRTWTFADLKAALAQHGVPIAKSDGVKVIRRDDVADALADRLDPGPDNHADQNDEDDDPDDDQNDRDDGY